MPVTLVTGPHQSGKSRVLAERLRQAALGSAVLASPGGILTHEQVRAWHRAFGPGALPPTIALEDLLRWGCPDEPVPPAVVAHHLRRHLRGPLERSTLRRIASFRATTTDLADTCLRLQDHGIPDAALREAGASSGDHLHAKLGVVRDARRAMEAALLTRARALARSAGQVRAEPPPWSLIAIDDLISLTPAELEVLQALATRVDLVIAAVEDPRLGNASLAQRLRTAFPDAEELPLPGLHPQAPHLPPIRRLLEGALRAVPLPPDGLSCYHYADEDHAGRAIAAWLRTSGTAPGEVHVFVRTAGEAALALADSLRAAGVPVVARCQVPLRAVPAGALLEALGHWCAEPTWSHLLAVLARLPFLELPAGELLPSTPPTPLPDLTGPWGARADTEALAALERLGEPQAQDQEWQWSERGGARAIHAATLAWIRAWRAILAGATGTWRERVTSLAQRLVPTHGVEPLAALARLEAHAPVAVADLAEAIDRTRVVVERGEGAVATSLLLADAVRDRTEPRPVAILHGLEQGRWPAAPRRTVVIPRLERRHLAQALGRDPWDDDGQAAGEIASILATLARGTRRIVLGVPCGEREPAALLGELLAQTGRSLSEERGRVGQEVAPGAPLDAHESQGRHEALLWGERRRPSFVFRIAPRPPQDLGLAVGHLDQLLVDPFVALLDRLALRSPLQHAGASLSGLALHALLAELAQQPPERWDGEAVAGRWIAQGVDVLDRIQRQRQRDAIVEAVAAESALARGCEVRAEVQVRVPLPVPLGPAATALVILAGRADRIDRLPDGTVRVVDYKNQLVGGRRAQLKEGTEAQLAAYAHGLQADGTTRVVGAYYRALKDGKAAGYLGPGSPTELGKEPPRIDTILEQIPVIGEAIACLARGVVGTDAASQVCIDRGYAPIARLDEARLLPAETAEDEA